MKTIQPYFALSSTHYFKRVIGRYGITHLYEYVNNTDGNLPAIPDGCLDMLFDLDPERPVAILAGSVLACTNIPSVSGHRYFGVRFQPGFIPPFCDAAMRDLVGNQIALHDCLSPSIAAFVPGTADLAGILASLPDFSARADRFMELYLAALRKSDVPGIYTNAESWQSGTGSFLLAMREIFLQKGQVSVETLASDVGYSTRYLNTLFREHAGISPKRMCQIIRFQTAIDELDHDSDISLADLADTGRKLSAATTSAGLSSRKQHNQCGTRSSSHEADICFSIHFMRTSTT